MLSVSRGHEKWRKKSNDEKSKQRISILFANPKIGFETQWDFTSYVYFVLFLSKKRRPQTFEFFNSVQFCMRTKVGQERHRGKVKEKNLTQDYTKQIPAKHPWNFQARTH